MSQLTKSEQLFHEFCHENNFRIQRLEESSVSGQKTPDYEIESSTGQRIVVEIKQFDPDPVILENLRKNKFYFGGGTPGSKVRIKIEKASKQLKSRLKQMAKPVPTLLLLYNNIPYSHRGTDPYEVKTAMYGLEEYVLQTDPLDLKDCKFGKDRKMTPKTNTSISAIATLDEDLNLNVFHNIFAHTPLEPKDLQGSKIKHYTLEDKQQYQFQEWEEITV